MMLIIGVCEREREGGRDKERRLFVMVLAASRSTRVFGQWVLSFSISTRKNSKKSTASLSSSCEFSGVEVCEEGIICDCLTMTIVYS